MNRNKPSYQELERVISEAHTANKTLKSSLERVSDGVVVFDKDFNYTYINPTGAKLLGRTVEDLIGKNYYKEYPEAQNTVFAKAYRKAMERRSQPSNIQVGGRKMVNVNHTSQSSQPPRDFNCYSRNKNSGTGHFQY